MDLWIYILIFIIILAILLLLQIIYIRIKLGKLENDFLDKQLQASDYASLQMEKQTKLKIYGIKVDNSLTKAINQQNSSTRDLLIQNMNTSFSQVVIPYICNSKIEYRNDILQRFGFLSVYITDGATQLVQDCINKDVSYVIINNRILKIFYDDKLNSKLKDLVLRHDIDSEFSNCYVLTLYSLATTSQKPQNCDLNLVGFMGNFDTIGFDDTIDINSILKLSQDAPMHIIGYKVSK